MLLRHALLTQLARQTGYQLQRLPQSDACVVSHRTPAGETVVDKSSSDFAELADFLGHPGGQVPPPCPDH